MTGRARPVAPGRAAGRFTCVGHDLVTVFRCGDAMTGRGIGQILPYPGDPRPREAHVRGAMASVALAEAVPGPIPCPVNPAVELAPGGALVPRPPLAAGHGQAQRWDR